jgi:hypothetical protein
MGFVGISIELVSGDQRRSQDFVLGGVKGVWKFIKICATGAKPSPSPFLYKNSIRKIKIKKYHIFN